MPFNPKSSAKAGSVLYPFCFSLMISRRKSSSFEVRISFSMSMCLYPFWFRTGISWPKISISKSSILKFATTVSIPSISKVLILNWFSFSKWKFSFSINSILFFQTQIMSRSLFSMAMFIGIVPTKIGVNSAIFESIALSFNIL